MSEEQSFRSPVAGTCTPCGMRVAPEDEIICPACSADVVTVVERIFASKEQDLSALVAAARKLPVPRGIRKARFDEMEWVWVVATGRARIVTDPASEARVLEVAPSRARKLGRAIARWWQA